MEAVRLLFSTILLGACATPPSQPDPPLPPRPPGMPTGSAFAERVHDSDLGSRERLAATAILMGNVPVGSRTWMPVTVVMTLGDRRHSLTYWVTADYLAVGSNDDFLRMPLSPGTAQRLADALVCALPTAKMVDDIYRAATVRLEPRPFSPDEFDITSMAVFEASNEAIEKARWGRTGLIAGIKKDLVISEQILDHPDRSCIYGWHQLDGTPIQPLYCGHVREHVDYSHGVRLVHQMVHLDGRKTHIAEVLRDPVLFPMLSNTGPLIAWRYPVEN